MRLLFWPLVLVFLVACAAQQQSQSQLLSEQNVEQLQAGLTSKHPSAYIYLANGLWREGNQNDAVVMYYVGQIRYRAYLNTLPESEAIPEEQLYGELKAEFGDEVNEYAARDVNNWINLLDSALAWHKANPSEFLSKDTYSLLYELVIYDFKQLRTYVADNKAEIRARRAERGLENRL